MARVESVNVGGVRTVEWHGRQVTTGIWKVPVPGRVELHGVNLDGDAQADRTLHGGPDKAVYVYAAEDYEWWSEELQHEISPGTFGENLTTSGVELADAVIGTAWRIGSACLEVAQPRLPCFKLGIRMDDAAFVERFEVAARFGVYLRIVEEGDVGAGDRVEVGEPPDGGITAGEVGRARRSGDDALYRKLLDAPRVPEPWKGWAVRRLARAE